MARLERSARYTGARTALIIGIVLVLAGIYIAAVGLISEPVSPDLDLFDVLFIIPALAKLVIADMQKETLMLFGGAMAGLGAALTAFGGVGMYRYRDDPGRMVPQTEAEIQHALDELDRQLACGEITKEQYRIKQQSVIWRR